MAVSGKPKARQSQLVTTYGVGSLFPDADASYMICGIDDWDTRFAQSIEEPRLARTLGVNTFYAPPTGRKKGDVPAIRFPEWHYCSGCRRLAPFWKFGGKKGEVRCADCARDLTPSRFVACCENGHIEDFPYFQWVHRGQDAEEGAEHRLTLRSRGSSSSLASIVVSCSCGVRPYNLEGAFSAGALQGIRRCSGSRPWHNGMPNVPDCDRPLRVFQRGASNVWFPVQRSSISIPPWSSVAAQYVTKNWETLKPLYENAGEPVARQAIGSMIQRQAELSVDAVIDVVRQRLGLDAEDAPNDDALRTQEYEALKAGHEGPRRDSFQCLPVRLHPSLDGLVRQVSQVNRLREVRVLSGFSRVTPIEAEAGSARTAALSAEKVDWLPAVEVMGEGIFVRLDEAVVAAWEGGAFAQTREAGVRVAQIARDAALKIASEPVSARFIALHTLAHMLLKELSLDAGYPQGSIRERVYALPGQAGILLYTASSDSAGSLGGLAALAASDDFAPIFRNALERATWCSSDPVCAETGATGTDALNLAACHACVLAPETSCEHRNQYLDRLTVVGSPAAPEVGLGSSALDLPEARPAGGERAVVAAVPQAAAQLPTVWADALASPETTSEERILAERLVALQPVLPVPEIGAEIEGVIVSMAWDGPKVLVDLDGLTDADRVRLVGHGWTVLPPEPSQIVTALQG
ncbi:DUF1998 domain-containing protein [Myceligenerans pegani]|uniref:DUF1998 domain-containing protein n=1 Tax=Myceligenerans pegani TaxID=2776917 RepID=A0ABR9N2W6_9MICO|nr:DUF1998 domain-containing protein [Myceligenerans sp. TRM 65318]MBE1877566.1 DUF1998 domain-containing protein [Myceligenerans sp. TRM 65318]MBE3019837.1 DUF1998 domain-containing protein [Myceligenerans sp. TRM 65318]